MVLGFGDDVAFMKGVVDTWGFWGLTFVCMTPFFAFIVYVWKGPMALAGALFVETALLLWWSWKPGTAVPISVYVVAVLPALIGGAVTTPEILAKLSKKLA